MAKRRYSNESNSSYDDYEYTKQSFKPIKVYIVDAIMCPLDSCYWNEKKSCYVTHERFNETCDYEDCLNASCHQVYYLIADEWKIDHLCQKHV